MPFLHPDILNVSSFLTETSAEDGIGASSGRYRRMKPDSRLVPGLMTRRSVTWPVVMLYRAFLSSGKMVSRGT